MQRRLLGLALACAALALPGCIGARIAASGRDVDLCTQRRYDEAVASTRAATRDQVHRELGKPVALWQDGELACEFYQFRGPIKNLDSQQGMGWAYLFTLGLADLWFVPAETINYVQAKGQIHEMTLWFDSSGSVVGYYRGDIRHPEKPNDSPNWIGPERQIHARPGMPSESAPTPSS